MIISYNISDVLLRKLNEEIQEVNNVNYIEMYKNSDLDINVDDSITQSEINELDNIVSTHNSSPLLTEQIKDAYYEHRKSGVLFFDNTRAWLVAKVYQLELTESDVYVIESKINNALSMVNRGDWKSAKAEIVNNVSVDSVMTQDIYDYMLGGINEYINSNY